ncbi:hypothetical protein E3N88_14001 [Mikania micrantha]|uniref:Uncharacterized protein n=1 Tax=Mikania micrantha TaxID=192012 RepID=A0A5N6P1X2_9ASTR|nr:hypothetical protein E3N88_14001 [Mikania micrantha]
MTGELLRRFQIFFEVADMEQALQFMTVIRICIVFGIHVGTDWKAISDKYFKKDAEKGRTRSKGEYVSA